MPYYENGNFLGYMVADGTGTRYVNRFGIVILTEEGREQQEAEREEERRRLSELPGVSNFLDGFKKVGKVVNGGD